MTQILYREPARIEKKRDLKTRVQFLLYICLLASSFLQFRDFREDGNTVASLIFLLFFFVLVVLLWFFFLLSPTQVRSGNLLVQPRPLQLLRVKKGDITKVKPQNLDSFLSPGKDSSFEISLKNKRSFSLDISSPLAFLQALEAAGLVDISVQLDTEQIKGRLAPENYYTRTLEILEERSTRVPPLVKQSLVRMQQQNLILRAMVSETLAELDAKGRPLGKAAELLDFLSLVFGDLETVRKVMEDLPVEEEATGDQEQATRDEAREDPGKPQGVIEVPEGETQEIQLPFEKDLAYFEQKTGTYSPLGLLRSDDKSGRLEREFHTQEIWWFIDKAGSFMILGDMIRDDMRFIRDSFEPTERRDSILEDYEKLDSIRKLYLPRFESYLGCYLSLAVKRGLEVLEGEIEDFMDYSDRALHLDLRSFLRHDEGQIGCYFHDMARVENIFCWLGSKGVDTSGQRELLAPHEARLRERMEKGELTPGWQDYNKAQDESFYPWPYWWCHLWNPWSRLELHPEISKKVLSRYDEYFDSEGRFLQRRVDFFSKKK